VFVRGPGGWITCPRKYLGNERLAVVIPPGIIDAPEEAEKRW
jgi:hypothetical protein